MNDDTVPTDAATRAFSEEQNAAERSPAQPDDAHRIDASDVATEPPAAAHEKHERGGRLTH